MSGGGLRPVPQQPPRAVIYTRQSTYREESVSLELQETACRDHAARCGYDVVDVQADPGISGRTFHRKGVTAAMAAVEAGQADVIILWKWSRLSRRRLDWAIATDKVEQLGGRVESATEPADTTTAAGRLQRGMLAEFAAFESERIGEQWVETHDRRRKLGLPAQGGDRYGYTRHEDGTYSVDPEQAEVLVWCYEQAIAGRGFTWIATHLNRRGLRNQHGRLWRRNAVAGVLNSGFAAGFITHKNVHMPGAHPPIISEQQWAAYRAVRARQSYAPPRVVEPRYPLAGLIKCGDTGCGASMEIKDTGGRRYVCSRWRVTRQGRCVTVTRSIVEGAVLDWLRELADDLDGRAKRADTSAKRARLQARTDAKAAARDVAALDQQIAQLLRQKVTDRIPQSAYDMAMDELNTERDAAQARLDAAELAQHDTPGDARRIARGLVDEWDELPVHTRRELLSRLLTSVTIHAPARRYGRATVEPVPRWVGG